ncbi:MAG: ABC transporter permease, partial [Gammaproteobacteria bacterium]
MPAVLATDAVLYLLIAALAVFALYARRHEHLRAPWRQVRRRPVAMAALVVLAWFAAIGLADSIHYRPRLPAAPGAPAAFSPEVLSLFDAIATPLRERVEQTYSAPFATHLYSMTTRVGEDGRQVRSYERLIWGGAHLGPDVAGKWRDIAATAARAALVALATWCAVAALLVYALSRRWRRCWRSALDDIAHARTEVPWAAILATAGVLAVASAVIARLALDWHVLGTDKVGQDVLYATLKSIRTGLLIGTLTTLVVLPLAITLGIMAGYFGRWVDDVIQYLYTTLNSIPGVLLIAAAVLMLQVHMNVHAEDYTSVAARADVRLLFLCIILGITSWTGLCRLLRAETLKLREADYVRAAASFGVGHGRIMARHVLPNVFHIVIISV